MELDVSSLSIERPPSTRVELSPFLRLPIEIRKLIYQHVIPNQVIVIWEPGTKSPHQFRDDGVCSSSILRVNRKIYRELYGDWYGKVMFSVRLEQDETRFVNQCIPHGEALPSTILAIRSLHIFLYLVPLGDSIDRFHTRTHHIRALANMLSSEQSSLEKLQVKVWAGVGSYTPVRRDGDGDGDGGRPYEGLEANLQPFQSVRGLSQVSFHLEVSDVFTKLFHRSEAQATEWITGAREYLHTLESIMRSTRVEIE